MEHEITADFSTLLKQAPMTAGDYLIEGIRRIDEQLGEGYAETHPQLLGAFMQTCARDLRTATLAQQLRLGLVEIAMALRHN